MNWNLLLVKAVPIIIGTLVIYVSYKLPPYFLRDSRKNKMKKATAFEIISAFIINLGCSAIMAGIFSFNDNNWAESFTMWFSISGIPVIAGLWSYFEKDAKKTITERVIDNIQINKEQQEAPEQQDY